MSNHPTRKKLDSRPEGEWSEIRERDTILPPRGGEADVYAPAVEAQSHADVLARVERVLEHSGSRLPADLVRLLKLALMRRDATLAYGLLVQIEQRERQ